MRSDVFAERSLLQIVYKVSLSQPNIADARNLYKNLCGVVIRRLLSPTSYEVVHLYVLKIRELIYLRNIISQKKL